MVGCYSWKYTVTLSKVKKSDNKQIALLPLCINNIERTRTKRLNFNGHLARFHGSFFTMYMRWSSNGVYAFCYLSAE